MIDRETGNIVETVENRIPNAIRIANDSILTPKVESAIRSPNASTGQNAASVMANSKRGEHRGVPALFEDVSERSNTSRMIRLEIFFHKR